MQLEKAITFLAAKIHQIIHANKYKHTHTQNSQQYKVGQHQTTIRYYSCCCSASKIFQPFPIALMSNVVAVVAVVAVVGVVAIICVVDFCEQEEAHLVGVAEMQQTIAIAIHFMDFCHESAHYGLLLVLQILQSPFRHPPLPSSRSRTGVGLSLRLMEEAVLMLSLPAAEGAADH